MRLCALLSLLVIGVNCLDSEDNEPIYKFTEVSGAPDSLNGSTGSFPVSDFSECISKCSEDVECVLAHQESSDAPCLLFPWGSVTGVRNNASGGEGQVAFKVFTDQPACDLNAHYLLNGKTYPLLSNDTEKYRWRIDTSETGWTITYLPCGAENQEVCGNWGTLRPYEDSCNNECKLTMIQIYAEPGNIQRSSLKTIKDITSWRECMILCYLDYECTVVHYEEGQTDCIFYSYASLTVLTKKSAEDGQRMAIKVPTSNVTCSWSTEQLLQDTYYLPYQRMYTRYLREFFRIQTFEKFYLMMFYRDANATYNLEIQKCPSMFLGIGAGPPQSEFVCEHPFRSKNISQPEAKEICEAMGGHLIVEINHDAMTRPYGSAILFDFYLETGRVWEMGNVEHNRFWMGLEKTDCIGTKNESLCREFNGWEWAELAWISVSKLAYKDQGMPMTWAPGEPSGDPKKKCAYLQLGAAFPGCSLENSAYSFKCATSYSLVSAECESRDVDGFICGLYEQTWQNKIRTYKDVADEYGTYEKSCCQYNQLERQIAMKYPKNFVPMNGSNSTVKDEL